MWPTTWTKRGIWKIWKTHGKDCINDKHGIRIEGHEMTTEENLFNLRQLRIEGHEMTTEENLFNLRQFQLNHLPVFKQFLSK